MTRRRCAAGPAGGYTLIELLVTAAVASILAAFVVPSFDRLVQDNRRTTVVNELLASVMRARAEAAKRGDSVVVCGFDDADGNGRLDEPERACTGQDWSDGWLAAAWHDADGDGRADAQELVAPPILQVVNGQRRIRILASPFAAGAAPAGVLVLRTFGRASSNGTLTVCDDRGDAHARAIIVAPTGRSRVAGRRADGSDLRCGNA